MPCNYTTSCPLLLAVLVVLLFSARECECWSTKPGTYPQLANVTDLCSICPTNTAQAKCFDQKCTCAEGFHDHINADGSITLCTETTQDVYPALWGLVRAYFTVVYFILVVIAGIGWVGTGSSGTEATVGNIKRLALLSAIVPGFLHVLFWAIDPNSLSLIFPVLLSQMLAASVYPFSILAFGSILLHWIELYYVALTTIKRERMLESINSRYQARGLTVEDIQRRVTRLRKLQIPFVIAAIVAFAIQIAYNVLVVYAVSHNAVFIAWAIVFILLFFSFSLGFLIYGRRLAALMPPEISMKVIRIARRITALCAVVLVIWIMALVIILGVQGIDRTKYRSILLQFIVYNLWAVILFTMVFILVKPRQIKNFLIGILVRGKIITHNPSSTSFRSTKDGKSAEDLSMESIGVNGDESAQATEGDPPSS